MSRVPEAKVVRGSDAVSASSPRPVRGRVLVDAVELTGDLRTLDVPATCACCRAAIEASNVVTYCSTCRRHQVVGHAVAIAVGACALVCGVSAIEWVHHAWPFAGALPQTVAVFVAGLVPPAVALGVALARRNRSIHAHWGTTVGYDERTAVFRNVGYGEAVAELNGRTLRRRRVLRVDLVTVALAVAVLPVIPAGFAYVNHDHRMFDLYIDNGSAAAVDVRAGDHHVASIPAGAHGRVRLPRARFELHARTDNESIDSVTVAAIDEHVDSATGFSDIAYDVATGVYVWNVARQRCYRESTKQYGSNMWVGVGRGNDDRLVDSRVFRTTANPPLQPAPNAVRTYSSIGFAFRTELMPVPCPRPVHQ